MPETLEVAKTAHATAQKPFYRREKFWLGLVVALIPAVNEATGLNLSIETVLLVMSVGGTLLGLKGVTSAIAYIQERRAEIEKAKSARIVVNGD